MFGFRVWFMGLDVGFKIWEHLLHEGPETLDKGAAASSISARYRQVA